MNMDYTYETFETVFLSLLGLCQSKTSVDDENAHKDAIFNPELVIAHCFKQFKQEDFHLPQSHRRIIILPQKEDPMPINPTPQPQASPHPIPSFKALEAGDIQEQPEDVKTWLSRRLKFRQDLESFGNTERWLQNKFSLTPSEAKILYRIHKEHEAQLVAHLATTRTTKKKNLRLPHRRVPQLRLPKPPTLAALYSYLYGRKIKILELFNRMDQGENQRISREEFIMALKALRETYVFLIGKDDRHVKFLFKSSMGKLALILVGVPLGNQEVEDIVIYLSSLGKQNSITTDILANTYKQWLLAQQRRALLATRESQHRITPQHPSKKQKVNLAPQPPEMDLLTVPVVDTQMEARPMTLEEMEDVGKRYRERKRQCKLRIPSIQYMEQCRLVRSGNKHFDEHCFPSTICGEMNELINRSRRDTFLVYLQCWKLCEYYGLPLTEDVLMKALLYPGDKIIFQKDQVRPIRQPGGYYSDFKVFSPPVAMLNSLGFEETMAKKTNKLSEVSILGNEKPEVLKGKVTYPESPSQPEYEPGLADSSPLKLPKKIKKIHFKEFEEFTRKLKVKRPSGPQQTHPNFFWPGHLLDKLQIYLPSVTTDRSLALFSCVQHQPHASSATYHPNHWWPIKNMNYLTCAHYDAPKVYHVN